jgi:hypothetical protein
LRIVCAKPDAFTRDAFCDMINRTPRQPVGAGSEPRVWSPRDSSRRNHGWQEVPHSSPTHSRSDDRPGEHRAGRADTDSLGLSDRIADPVFDPDPVFDTDTDTDGRITHGDAHSDRDSDANSTHIDSYGDADADRNATHIDSHGDADTDAAHSDSHGNGDSNALGDTVCDAHGDTDGIADTDGISVTDDSAPARSFPLLQGRDNEGLSLVPTS